MEGEKRGAIKWLLKLEDGEWKKGGKLEKKPSSFSFSSAALGGKKERRKGKVKAERTNERDFGGGRRKFPIPNSVLVGEEDFFPSYSA